MTRFIERRLRLKVNRDKSAVARTEERHVVGFVLKREPMDGDVEVLLSTRSKDRIDAKIVELTPRNWGNSLRACIRSLNVYLLGWIGFFGSCTAQSERTFAGLDAHIRRRLRAIQLKHWKRKRTVAQRLVRLGVRRHTAWRRVYQGRESLWALSHDPAVDRGLRNQRVFRRTRARVAGRTVAVPANRRPGPAHAGSGIGRGREPAGSGGNPPGGNPLPRRAVCEQHLYGSVRAAPW